MSVGPHKPRVAHAFRLRWYTLDKDLRLTDVSPDAKAGLAQSVGKPLPQVMPDIPAELLRCYEDALRVGVAACLVEYPEGTLLQVWAKREGDGLHVSYDEMQPEDLMRIVSRWEARAQAAAELQTPPAAAAPGTRPDRPQLVPDPEAPQDPPDDTGTTRPSSP